MPNVNLGTANIAIRARDRNTAQVVGQTADRVATLNQRLARTRARMRQANTATRNFNRAIASVGLGAGLLSGRLANVVRESTAFGAQLVEQGEAAGLSAERLQLLGRVFEGDGVSAEQLRTAMVALQRRMGDLRRGTGESLVAWQQLGLTFEDIAGLRVDQVLGRIADGIRAIDDPNVRVDVLSRLFEESGARLVPVLARGGAALEDAQEQQRRFGLVSNENAQILKDLAQSFTDVGVAIRVDLANTVAGLAPQLERSALQAQSLAQALIAASAASLRFIGGIRELGINFLAVGAGVRSYRQLNEVLRRSFTILRSGRGLIEASFTAIGGFLERAGQIALAIQIARIAFLSIFDFFGRYTDENIRAEGSVRQLSDRLGELTDRVTDFIIEGENIDELPFFRLLPSFRIPFTETEFDANNIARLLNLGGAIIDLNEIERILERIGRLAREQALRSRLPGLPPGYDPATGTIRDVETTAERQARLRAEAEALANQQALNRFAERRVALYRELARLAAQVELPEAPVERFLPPETDLDRRFREAVSPDPAAAREVRTIADLYARVGTAVRNAAEAQGGLADDQERILRAVAATANNRFADVELIRQGTDAAERGLRAQAESGEITRQTLEASLIVNRRIASLSEQVQTATGEEREQIARVLEDLNTRYPEIVERIASAMGEVAEETRNQVTALSTITEGFARGLERGILRAVREGGKLRDIFAAIGREITGTILSGLTRFAVNSLFTAIGLPGFGGGRQFGGLALPGRVYRVHQDELIVPANPARVIPAGAGGGSQISIAIDARGSDEASFDASLARVLPQLQEIFRADAVNAVNFGLNNPSPLRG